VRRVRRPDATREAQDDTRNFNSACPPTDLPALGRGARPDSCPGMAVMATPNAST
jgi:hypothetical protein